MWAAAASWALWPGTVSAHGEVPASAPTVVGLLFDWTFDPALIAPLIAAAVIWIAAVRRVNARHPFNPVPRRRSVYFLAGVAAIAIALQSGIERYDTTLFSVHMVQHILLTMVAAPLIALGGPVTLALRVASPAGRQRVIMPILHSRAIRVISHPVVAWLLFAGVMWGAHFSLLFDAALEDRGIHDLEHLLFLGAGLLFWWPAVAVDPAPRRLGHPARILYVFLQMPQNTFLAVALLGASQPLYEHYVTLARTWGPDPLADQQMAAGIMWLVGDLLFLGAVFALIASWMRAEDRGTAAADRRTDAARAAIQERADRLAAARQAAGGVVSGSASRESPKAPSPAAETASAAGPPAATRDTAPDSRFHR